MNTAYRELRANGDIFVALGLVGCLIFSSWPLTALSLFLFLILVTSNCSSILDSINSYNFSLFKTNRGIYYNAKILCTVLLMIPIYVHNDGLSGLETPAKTLLVAYIIVMNIDRFRWKVLLCGTSAGALLALTFGLFQVGLYVADRSGGATNPIRFGMIALALGSICAVGLLYSHNDRRMAALSFAGFCAGIGGAFLSGSRGAMLALPFMLLLLAPVLWRRSSRALLMIPVFMLILAGALLVGNVGKMSTRIATAYTNISMGLTGGEAAMDDRSVGDRTKLLFMAFRLFEQHPAFGVGANGWNDESARLAAAPDPNDRITYSYNQAHNQYADDLAKGGIFRFLLGFINLFLPLYLFLKCEPFADKKGSEFALAGVIVSLSFMIFSLSESLMILSLPAMVHAMLTFYLLAACDEARRKSDLDKARAVAAT
ncbi:O-antigen ligase family protein [Mesorhizobium sp. BAC0120]|uniref:O-antigen ligase family protein n=1 Tax=Mesorhizobium sp. BAC0120 TaxID=3090670 RepID=UPI00298CAB80|nr:O-antigen ligase family protein [Mesorhizobium sp. BAC0120]MDW6020937.1 O-antigen ligase family protein [Mesorhizobium sp. BAC0120]